MKKEDHNAVPDSVLTKEFLSQFKTEDDVSKFLTKLHAQVLEKMLEGEMDVHLGYEKNSVAGNNSGNSRNGKYPKKIQTQHGESVISVPRDRNGEFEPIVVPKHESRGLSIERLVISLYSKEYMAKDRTVRGRCQEEICSASLVARCPKRNSLPKTIGRIPKIGKKWRFAECVQKRESSTQYV